MKPPQESQYGVTTIAGQPAADFLRFATLTKRSDFLRAARAPRVAMPGFILQVRRRSPHDEGGMRVGYTCSKKVGNAVARNRAKRRLRAMAHEVLPQIGRDGTDYVLIGRAKVTAERPFEKMCQELRRALEKLNGSGK
ncbi:MAG: ribonuclease P protein component [Roseobacter sp.]